jgi:hypothetical protein
MASATRPTVEKAGSPRTSLKIVGSDDSREALLKDVVRGINEGIDGMQPVDRKRAIADIHAIAENVRKRQAKSAGR